MLLQHYIELIATVHVHEVNCQEIDCIFSTTIDERIIIENSTRTFKHEFWPSELIP